MTAGRVPYASSRTRLVDDSDLTFAVDTLTTTGLVIGTTKISSYNGVATVSGGVPAELATIDLTGQSAIIVSTGLYNVPAAGVGLYRVCGYLKVTTPATTSSTLGYLSIGFTDATDSVAQAQLMAMSTEAGVASSTNTLNTTATKLSGCVVVWAKASTPITYAINYLSSGGTAMVYEAHLKLEAM